MQSIRRWRNGGKFDGALLSDEEKSLRAYYKTVLTLCNKEKAIREGDFYDVMFANYENQAMDTNHQYAFLRKSNKELILVIANFEGHDVNTEIRIPADAFTYLQIPADSREIKAKDLLTGKTEEHTLAPDCMIKTTVEGHNGKVLKFKL